jgi:ArsR family transcriptional regulator, arsenate/arsenite/antimonite-responsive transcriptional repressor
MKTVSQGHIQPAPVNFAKALADETRQKIMKLCCCQSLSVTEIVEQLDVAQPTVSHHLAILKEAGLVDVRPDGKQTFYSLNQERVANCCGQLMRVFAPEDEATKTLGQFDMARSSAAEGKKVCGSA